MKFFNIKYQRSQEKGRAPIWIITYADMMTNLMLFFLVMYAYSRMGMGAQDNMQKMFKHQFSKTSHEAVAAGTAGQDMAVEEMQQEANRIKGFMKVNEENIKFSLPGEVLFDLGSADLKDSAKEMLLATANILKKLDNTIIIEGYTDDLPINTPLFTSNWELSMARAESVVNFFTQEGGIPTNRLCLAGYGEYKPCVPNTGEENRAKNRRIELSIIKKDVQ